MQIKKIFKMLKKLLKNLSKSNSILAKMSVVRYSKHCKINDKLVLFEAFMGNDFSGNPFYIFEQMCTSPEYSSFKKIICVNKEYVPKIKAFITKYGYTHNVRIVKRNTPAYCKALSKAKYLVNNVSFPTYFVKRDGQVFLNTWHGTPLKALGRSIKDNPTSIGNVQRNFLMCDYLLYPNKYSFEHIREDYMLTQFYKGDYVLAGYPCNSRFFKNDRAADIRKELSIENKRAIVYMPTWRDASPDGKDNQLEYMMLLINELERTLDGNTVVFVKLHHLASGKISFDGFDKIKPFPSGYETYDLLSCCDSLITDYSSVMFDFACSGKSIYLYTYDKDEYMAGRSMYLDISELPFFASGNAEQLATEIMCDKKYDYTDFVREYCAYESSQSAEKLTNLLINGKRSDNMELIHGTDLSNGKQNVLIFTGSLDKNGMTTALKNLVASLDTDKRNYVLAFYAKKAEVNKLSVNEIRRDVTYMAMLGNENISFFELFVEVLHYFNFNFSFVNKAMDRINKRELERLYPNIKFDYAIHFTGYERRIMQLYGRLDGKLFVWVHNNMYNESRAKNVHISSVKYAYDKCDKIVVVRETMKEELTSFAEPAQKDKITVVHNVNDAEGVRAKALEEIEFQRDTYCNVTIEELNRVLDSDVNKLINIARFSKEKGIDTLITAFDKYRKEIDKEAYLIIIGGYGEEFESIKAMVEERENIILIKSIMNPYPILNKCDLFVLSSHYEGLPMTIIEALMLDKRVLSTNITGPKEFLEQGYGYLVDDSENGLYEGMKMFKENTIPPLTPFDVNAFNKNAIDEFESLFS